jgi:hypothetical protein
MPLASQNLEQDEEVIGQESVVIGDEGRGDFLNSSSLTHARRPRVRPCGPCHTLRVLLTQCRLTALRPSGTSLRYRPSLFFKIQNLKFNIPSSLRVHSRPFASIRGSMYSFQLSAFSFQLLFPHTLPPRPFATFAPWR